MNAGRRKNLCFAGAFGNVTGLAEIEAFLFLDYVYAQKRFQIVRFGDGVPLLQDIAELSDQGLITSGDGKVINVDAEVDAVAIRVDFEEKAGIIDGALISTSLEIRGELIVKCLGSPIETIQCAVKFPYGLRFRI